MKKIRAVNICLLGIGASPVSSLDEGNLDSNSAEFYVDQASEIIQSKGWWFNKEGNWNIEPDSVTGEIPVPNSVTDIVHWGTSREAELAQRDGKVYDTYNHSFDLSDAVNQDGKIEFVFITILDFDDLPGVAQQAVAYLAKRMYEQDQQGDTEAFKKNQMDEMRTYAALTSAEGRNKKLNFFSHNSDAANMPLFIGGPNAMNGLRLSSAAVFPRRRSST